MFAGLKKKVNGFYARSLHRELLEQIIREKSGFVSGQILDIGSRNRRYDSFFPLAREIVAIDKNPQRPDVLAADALSLPFLDKTFDGVVSFEVFEYVLEIQKVLREIARVLKPQGTLLFSVPFLNPVHGDVDYVRLTLRSWQFYLNETFAVTEIISFGGRFTLIWDFAFEKVRNFSGRAGKLFWLPFFWATKKIALWLDRKDKNPRYPMGYVIRCAVKPVSFYQN